MKKTLEEIVEIISAMDDSRFNKIMEAENDYWEPFDNRVSRNGYKRMKYNLEQEGLTVDDWFRWCAA